MYPDSHKWTFPIKIFWYDEKEIEDDDGDTSITQTTTRRTIRTTEEELDAPTDFDVGI